MVLKHPLSVRNRISKRQREEDEDDEMKEWRGDVM